MAQIKSLFATRLYKAKLEEFGKAIDYSELKQSCVSIATDDIAGQEWCETNNFSGYTSYASLLDLPWRFSIFKNLVGILDEHVRFFSKDLAFDIELKKVKLDSLWINVLPPGGVHTSHIHPHSIISGTIYVAMPNDTSAIKFEDPRLSMMMAAPSRKTSARMEMQNFIYISPTVGDVLLWESWLRHEVPMNMSDENRISISFNYGVIE